MMATTKRIVILSDFFEDFKALFSPKLGWETLSMSYKQSPQEILSMCGYPIHAVIFTGGSDVYPQLYGDAPHPQTGHANIHRDMFEKEVFNLLPKSVLKLGVCRGIQMLHVLQGGRLIQHIDGHAGVKQALIDPDTGDEFVVTSTHHQCLDMNTGEGLIPIIVNPRDNVCEVAHWPDTNTLAVQFHPEWGPMGSTEYFLRLIDKLAEFPVFTDNEAIKKNAEIYKTLHKHHKEMIWPRWAYDMLDENRNDFRPRLANRRAPAAGRAAEQIAQEQNQRRAQFQVFIDDAVNIDNAALEIGHVDNVDNMVFGLNRLQDLQLNEEARNMEIHLENMEEH